MVTLMAEAQGDPDRGHHTAALLPPQASSGLGSLPSSPFLPCWLLPGESVRSSPYFHPRGSPSLSHHIPCTSSRPGLGGAGEGPFLQQQTLLVQGCGPSHRSLSSSC